MKQNHPSEQKRLYVWIPLRLFAEVQYQANLSGQTLTGFVIDALTEKLRRDVNEK